MLLTLHAVLLQTAGSSSSVPCCQERPGTAPAARCPRSLPLAGRCVQNTPVSRHLAALCCHQQLSQVGDRWRRRLSDLAPAGAGSGARCAGWQVSTTRTAAPSPHTNGWRRDASDTRACPISLSHSPKRLLGARPPQCRLFLPSSPGLSRPQRNKLHLSLPQQQQPGQILLSMTRLMMKCLFPGAETCENWSFQPPS